MLTQSSDVLNCTYIKWLNDVFSSGSTFLFSDSLVSRDFSKLLFFDEISIHLFQKKTPLFKHFNFLKIEGYGLTESSSTGTVTDPDDLSLGCVGAPLLGMN